MKYEILLFGIIGLLALANLAGLGVWVVHHARRLQGQPGLLAPQWSLLHVWFSAQIALAVFALIALPLLNLALGAKSGEPPIPEQTFNLPMSPMAWAAFALLSLMQQGAFVGLSWILLKKFGSDWAQIGLRGLPDKTDWIQGLVCGMVLLLMSALVEVTLNLFSGGSYRELVSREDGSSQFVQEAMRALSNSPILWAGLGLFVVVLAPITEEIFFRGLLYNALRRRFGHSWAAPVSGAIFAAIHASFVGFLPRWIMGWLLANFYRKSGSLWVPIIAHGVNNAAALIVLSRLSTT